MSLTTERTGVAPRRTAEEVARAEARTAHNYHPLPVVLTRGRGGLGDRRRRHAASSTSSRRYSALNFGHAHPQLLAAAHAQLDRLTLTSRAFVHDRFGRLLPPRSATSPARTWCCR